MRTLWEDAVGAEALATGPRRTLVGRAALVLTVAAIFWALGSPAAAQAAGSERPVGSPLEVTEDGKLIYGGDVVYECASIGSGIVMPAPNSSAKTRAELKRTNEEAVELCTESGYAPAGTEDDTLPNTGGPYPAALVFVAVVAGFLLLRQTVR